METVDREMADRTQRSRDHVQWEKPGLELSPGQVEAYLDGLKASGCAPETIQSYRRSLERLCRFLDDDKYIGADTLPVWQEHLLGTGYSSRTVNVCTAAANGLVGFLGHGELTAGRVPEEERIQPEMTRSEYLRLLSAARNLGKERAYLLVKLFATTGIPVGDMDKVTAETVREGKIRLPSGTLRIPAVLKEELLHYMQEEGISTGPVFLTQAGKPQERTVISAMIKSLSREARVSEEKANPRCLRKLYQTTQNGIWENVSLLAEQAHDRLLEKEQDAIGWKQSL